MSNLKELSDSDLLNQFEIMVVLCVQHDHHEYYERKLEALAIKTELESRLSEG